MIEIYFDDVLLDSDNYVGFSYSKHSFDKEFYLGSVASIEASLIIPKDALPSSLENVRIDIDGEDFLHLVVDEISINDNEEAEIKLTDQMINLGINYDISTDVPITAKDLLDKICNDFDLDHDEFSFDNEDVVLASYDGSLTAREYLSMIAELAGGYAQINNEGKLELKYYSNNNITNEITVDDIDSYKIKDDITIERVVYEFGTLKKESDSDQSKYTLYLNPENMFLQVITDEQFENICDKIIGFTFSNIEIPTTNLIFANQDLINFVDMNGSSHTILNEVEADFAGSFVGTYNYKIENTKQEFTEIKSSVDKVNRIKIIVDQQKGSIERLVESVDILEDDNDKNKSNIATITNNVSLLQTSTYSKIQVQQMQKGNNYFTTEDEKFTETTNYYKKVNDNYVLLVKGTDYNVGDLVNEIGFAVYEFGEITTVRNEIGTFSDEGLRIEKKGSDDNRNTISIYNEKGVQILNYDESNEIFFSGYVDDNRFGEIYQGDTLVYTKNLISKGYTEVGVHGRFEEYPGPNNENGVGFFVI